MGFTLQGVGPFLHWMTLGALCVFPVLAALVIYKLGSLPGSVARSRGHPRAGAINIDGWMGIITIVLWPIAMVWAHLVPGRLGDVSAGLRSLILQTEIRTSDRLECFGVSDDGQC